MKVNFINGGLSKRSYTTANVNITIRQEELIGKKEFTIPDLDLEDEIL